MPAAALRRAPAKPQPRTSLLPIRIKAGSIAEDGSFEGYGNVFGVVDSYGDIVLPGAFAESLAQYKAEGRLPKLLLQHDHEKVIGAWTEMVEDSYGLRCKGQLLLDVAAARETHVLMKAGALDGLSIGGEPMDTEPAYVDELPALGIDIAAAGAAPDGQVRLVKSWHLWEVSVVTFPANSPSLIDTVKRGSLSSASDAHTHPRRSVQPRIDDRDLRALERALAERQRAFQSLLRH